MKHFVPRWTDSAPATGISPDPPFRPLLALELSLYLWCLIGGAVVYFT